MSSYWDIRQLSAYLNVKPSTLYAWVAQRKIPCRKIHRLVRFDPIEIDRWLASFVTAPLSPAKIGRQRRDRSGVDQLIARAKREVYTPAHGETRPKSSLIGKEERDGAPEA
jgi:excisionase family DNA binding protein